MLPIRMNLRNIRNVFRSSVWKNVFITHSKMPMSTTSASQKRSIRLKSTLKLSAIGLGVGTIVGTGYSIHLKNKPRGHIVNEQTTIKTVNEIPNIEASRKIRIVGDQTQLKLTLYQYENCPFCSKVRAYLDYYGISYDVVEVDPVLRQAVKWSDYKKVPILVVQVENGYQICEDVCEGCNKLLAIKSVIAKGK